VALVGLIHAGEAGPELILPVVRKLLEQDGALLKRVGLDAMPAVNLDGRELMSRGLPWYLRTNSRGVDLNRNFDADWETVEYGYGLVSSDPDAVTYRGPKAASEPETRAVINFLRHSRPVAVFSHHCLASICGAHLLSPAAAADDRPFSRRCNAIARTFIRAFYPEDLGLGATRPGTSAGSLPAWLYREFSCPAFDLEGTPEIRVERAAIADRTTRAMIEEYADRHYRATKAVMKRLARRAK
jgi:hypothetical protein